MENKEGGTVILLNGASSAGKTTLAKALQKVMDAPYLHVPVDSFCHMLPDPVNLGSAFVWQSVVNRMLSGFHYAVGALAATGNNLIVDHVLLHGEDPENQLSECLGVLAPYIVYFIGVHCSLEELRRREKARGDRGEGQAEWQMSRVHQPGVYDLEVDTSLLSTEQCALQIKERVEHGASPQALQTLLDGFRVASNETVVN